MGRGSQSLAMACTGKYQLTKSENFEEFMKALGVGLVTRKLGNKSSPTITVTEENGLYTFKQESLVKTSEIKFKIGEEFEEVTADGRKVMSKMTLTAPNVMVHAMEERIRHAFESSLVLLWLPLVQSTILRQCELTQ